MKDGQISILSKKALIHIGSRLFCSKLIYKNLKYIVTKFIQFKNDALNKIQCVTT